VGFIGDFEIERAQSIFYLAQNDVPVRIWGPNWDRKCQLSHPNMRIEGKPLWGDDYAKAICSFDINLVFLRKINRDLQTTRSIEIPACGGFMLSERTNEHLELFEEGEEAEFFSTNEELLEKTRHYLNHQERREQIARSGRERCLRSGYSNQERIKEMIRIIESLR
jgi:spore maturation protein CgeB